MSKRDLFFGECADAGIGAGGDSALNEKNYAEFAESAEFAEITRS
jgi:hypothetical protein